MSPKARIALTFLLVVLAVAIWGVSQLSIWYDRAALGGSERVFAAFLFVLAIVLNLPDVLKRKKRPRQTAAPDYYILFDETGPHAPARPGRPQRPGPLPHPSAAHPGHGHPDATGSDHQHDRRH